ncbi:hypothetical protein [Burkholderia stagnalis]|uniref:Uncharacterized protein n=1 Tax=Burkholderia stagnalis TaxID=1503054 RepID=A0A104UN33_9BURK|nr:hypothetical protein [Burkholderia stagnalis]KVO56589.1 hypothetical protein WT18_20370 [Burkholderia stagnalis]KVP13877.1 hypothetical protein WT20_07060 [Burkholderia stagnalis]KVW93864.1 hypothetical protein WT30_18965 [Burkholderia stagnalis]KVZ05926.1 hypothetical protein WT35_24360 [Burkholderia stagnalis]KWA50580.1 hypothetical protein WT43_29225 [Burkholderia stagnalis]
MEKKERTQSIIENFRGNCDEFVMLKGVLCASHQFDSAGDKAYRELIDTLMIAKRMDELRACKHAPPNNRSRC